MKVSERTSTRRWYSIGAVALALCPMAAGAGSAEPPVTLNEDASTFTLVNGHVTARVNKRSGTFSLKYNGLDVITRGYGAMPDYATQIPVRDRWAIVAHVRVLQLSQGMTLDELPPAERDAHFGKGGQP